MFLLRRRMVISVNIFRNDNMSRYRKIPFLILLSVSLFFVIFFITLDTITSLIGIVDRKWNRTLVESPGSVKLYILIR